MSDLFGTLQKPTPRADVEAREYHTQAMRDQLRRLRVKATTTGRAADRKAYYQLRDYMEKIGPEEWAAQCQSRRRRKR